MKEKIPLSLTIDYSDRRDLVAEVVDLSRSEDGLTAYVFGQLLESLVSGGSSASPKPKRAVRRRSPKDVESVRRGMQRSRARARDHVPAAPGRSFPHPYTRVNSYGIDRDSAVGELLAAVDSSELSIQTVCRNAGLGKTYIYQARSGKSNAPWRPACYAIDALCSVLNIDAQDFVERHSATSDRTGSGFGANVA